MADRLISEQAVLDEVSRWRGYLDDDMINRIQIGMKRLPSAQQWIPVSERLPEEDDDVLITDDDGGVDTAHYSFNSWTDEPLAEWWCGCGEYRVYPIAWQPLPEPYKGGEQDGQTD